MKRVFFIVGAFLFGCAAAKQQTVTVEEKIPACIQQMIEQFSKEDKQNPPRSILSYTYGEKTVYYVTAPCCDFFSDLYDDSCRLIGHPDGGFTGRGDGSFPDFKEKASNEKLVWKDERK